MIKEREREKVSESARETETLEQHELAVLYFTAKQLSLSRIDLTERRDNERERTSEYVQLCQLYVLVMLLLLYAAMSVK